MRNHPENYPENYPLSSSERERHRLKMQAQALIPLSERMLSGAGIAHGAQVLELGCGSGEMTLLLASAVGPTGRVTALDSDPAQIKAATEKLADAGFCNVNFVLSDMNNFVPGQVFDAIVGRYFLLYIADPEGALARMVRWVKPGGVLAFLEMDFCRGTRSSIWPPVAAETNSAIEFIADVMLDAGINPHMGVRLPSMLAHYGAVHAETAAPLQFGASSIELPLEAVRSVIPMARKLGRSDACRYDVDALITAELQGRDHRTVTMPPLSVAAWVRIRS
ncbi:MAG: class I SAM-dependent methyltransferase [Pseudomonadota bacterium]